MSSVFYRDLKDPPDAALFTRHSAIYTGKHKLLTDLSSGAGITCLGHSSEDVKAAMCAQIDREPYVHSMNFTHPKVEELASKLIDLVVAGDSESKFVGGKVFFLNSGAEAVEAACKIGAQYGVELGGFEPAYLARAHSYHGNTMFTLGLGDHPRKKQFPFNPNRVAFRMNAFAPSWGMMDGLEKLDAALESLSYNAAKYQPIVVVEPIGGTTLGIEPPTADYLNGLIDLCSKHNAVLIFDEVLSGNYRTGCLFAYQHYTSWEPDIICLGKGLTAGYFPLSAVIVSRHIVEKIYEKSGKLWHSTTNQNHPVGCAAGVAALKVYQETPNGQLMVWLDRAKQFLGGQPGVEAVVGMGTLYGVRLVRDIPGLHLKVRELARKNELAIYTEGQTVNKQGNFVLLAPPYTIAKEQLDNAVDRLAGVIAKALT